MWRRGLQLRSNQSFYVQYLLIYLQPNLKLFPTPAVTTVPKWLSLYPAGNRRKLSLEKAIVVHFTNTDLRESMFTPCGPTQSSAGLRQSHSSSSPTPNSSPTMPSTHSFFSLPSPTRSCNTFQWSHLLPDASASSFCWRWAWLLTGTSSTPYSYSEGAINMLYSTFLAPSAGATSQHPALCQFRIRPLPIVFITSFVHSRQFTSSSLTIKPVFQWGFFLQVLFHEINS